MVESTGTGGTREVMKKKSATTDQYILSVTTLKQTLKELQSKSVDNKTLVAAIAAIAKFAKEEYG